MAKVDPLAVTLTAMMSPRAIALLAAVTCACASGAAEIRQAREARYGSELSPLWTALLAEVGKHAKVKSVDTEARLIVTDWEIIERFADQENASRRLDAKTAAPQVVGRDELKPAANFFRYRIRVEGDPLWRVVVDGEAALYRSGASVLRPYARGADDEPAWVQGRIDGMAVDLHAALRPFEHR